MIDMVQCVTKTDLFVMVERVYQKEESLVRKERKVTRPLSVTKFEQAISKGFTDNKSLQVSFELREEGFDKTPCKDLPVEHIDEIGCLKILKVERVGKDRYRFVFQME